MKNIKKLVLVLFAVSVISVSFISRYTYLIEEFENTARYKEAMINEYIELSSSFIELMSLYGNDFFLNNNGMDSESFEFLKYNPNLNRYNMDAVHGTVYEKTNGNLTGIGNIPESGVIRDEINLALQYNKFFSSFYKRLPDIQWLYYTSESNFMNMYPWVSSKEFAYRTELKSVEFYKLADPQNNYRREKVWTPAYIDRAGKGLMVTLSAPIYHGDVFKGVVSLDLTAVKLSELISSSYESYIIDVNDSIIATSRDIKLDNEIIKLNKLMNSPDNGISELIKIKSDRAQKLGSYYIYSAEFENVPWNLVFRVPVFYILYQSLLYTIPIVIICMLLFLTIYEVEERKKTAALLQNSLEELRSYQDILENAAKFDFLTSTYNRRGFKESFAKSANLSSGAKIPIAFILGDIDYFKKINDTYGHAAGDIVLIEIASMMKKNINKTDIICRWGGEEFLMALFNRTYDEAIFIAEHIRKEIEDRIFACPDSMELKVTMTFGVSEFDSDTSIDDNVSKADSALYIAKKMGRNRVIGHNADSASGSSQT